MSISPVQKQLYLILFSFFLALASFRGIQMAIALTAIRLGANEFTIGVLASMYGLFPLLLSIYAGRISDRIGCRRPILYGLLTTAAGSMIPVFFLDLPALFLSPALFGSGLIFVMVSVHRAMGIMSTPETRSRNFALMAQFVSLGTLAGPLMTGAVIDHLGNRTAFALLTGALLIAAAIAWFLPEAGAAGGSGHRQAARSPIDLLAQKGIRRAIMISGIGVCGIELFAFYLPIYGASIGLSATLIGTILALHAVASLIIRSCMGFMLRRHGELQLLSPALLIAAVICAAFPFSDHTAWLIVLSFLLGLAFGMSAPLTISLTYNQAPAERTGEALGLRLTLNMAMQAAVPLAFGALGAAFGMAPVFWADAAILLSGGLLARAGLPPR